MCHSPHWGNHMAAADKTKRGSVRIYMSNKGCGDAQTEHVVNIVRWKLSSRCWSAGFLISRGNSVQCFCTAVYRHTLRPANISSLCRFYHRWRHQPLQRANLGRFTSWTFRAQMPAEKGEKGLSGRLSAGCIHHCRDHRRACSIIRDPSRPHQEPDLMAEGQLLSSS